MLRERETKLYIFLHSTSLTASSNLKILENEILCTLYKKSNKYCNDNDNKLKNNNKKRPKLCPKTINSN